MNIPGREAVEGLFDPQPLPDLVRVRYEPDTSATSSTADV